MNDLLRILLSCTILSEHRRQTRFFPLEIWISKFKNCKTLGSREEVLQQKGRNIVHDILFHLMNLIQLKEAVIYIAPIQLLVQRKVAEGEHRYRFTLQTFQNCSMGLKKSENTAFCSFM